MSSAAGIIFSNLHDKNLPELTRVRTTASIPFGCRYRFIDFPLSNMVNAGISNISVITHYNYHSLMDHIGSGKDWDLARRSGGITILPPFITVFDGGGDKLYHTRLEALKSIRAMISRLREDYVVLSDCDTVANIDLARMLRTHRESGADITIAVRPPSVVDESRTQVISQRGGEYSGSDFSGISPTAVPDYCTAIRSGSDGRVTDIYGTLPSAESRCDLSMNLWIVGRSLLGELISDAAAHGYVSFTRDILGRGLGRLKIRAVRCGEWSAQIHSLRDYYACTMDIISDEEKRAGLFGVPERPIYTKIRNSPPTSYTDYAEVSSSLIADGCSIEGSVENSVLFRGVKIGKGAVVKNSILFQDTVVGSGAVLGCVIADKNSVIREGRILSGYHTFPLYIDKGAMI